MHFYICSYIAKAKGNTDYIMISNNEGGTALHVAADNGSIEV